MLREATLSKLVIESPILVNHPIRVMGHVIADKGYLAIWFIFRGKWYDIGKFYDRKGNWIGYYCDIIKPVRKLLSAPSRTSVITDLFLDLWITPDGRTFILDEDELEEAVKKHYVSPPLAHLARTHMRYLTRSVQRRRFPPRIVRNAAPIPRPHSDRR